MSLSPSEIEVLIKELGPALAGGWIQKIHQPAPRVVTLDVRAQGRTRTLFMSADPETARIHLASRRSLNPPSPPPFCQFLRAHIQGARIDGIEQIAGDRLVRLRLTAREGPCSLVAELTGRSAGLLLLDADDRVLALLVERRHKTGEPWRPPTHHPPADIEVRVPASPPDQDGAPFPISRHIEERYREHEEKLARERLAQARLAEIKKAAKKIARRIDALRADLDKAGRYRNYSRYGELLKAHLGRIVKGQDQVMLVDYFDRALLELTIPLDPSKGPAENMEEYFKKYRKYTVATRQISPRIEAAEQQLDRLHVERQAIQNGTWQPPTGGADSTRTRPGPQPSPLSPPRSARSGPFRRFTSADGLPIYVGRNARENEELTFRFAKSDDLWLHACGVPGSHVIVRLAKGTNPPQETVRDAAMLALLYSDLKKSGKGEVIHTRRKWVKKSKGRSPGTVTVTQETSLFVQLDRARLERLKERPS